MAMGYDDPFMVEHVTVCAASGMTPAAPDTLMHGTSFPAGDAHSPTHGPSSLVGGMQMPARAAHVPAGSG
jgi:hypothetical protein